MTAITSRLVTHSFDTARNEGKKVPKATGRKLSSPPPTPPPSAGSGRRLQVGTPAAPKRNAEKPARIKSSLMIAGGIITVLLIVPVIAIVLHSARKTKNENSTVATATPSVEAKAPTVSAPTAEPTADTKTASDPDANEVREMVLLLASQISQKGGYKFGPAFIEQIRARSHEYASEKALRAARQYKREINKSFHDEGLYPLIGYVLAMSRSKFDLSSSGEGIGIWQMPIAVARSQGYLGSAEDGAKLKDPEVSAQFAASYTRQLLSAFDSEDFMYALSCFGMTLQEAGQLQARLITRVPNTNDRRDIQKTIDSDVLSGKQVDNMARFFAAGIVGQNPQKFGLEDSQPFFSLY